MMDEESDDDSDDNDYDMLRAAPVDDGNSPGPALQILAGLYAAQ